MANKNEIKKKKSMEIYMTTLFRKLKILHKMSIGKMFNSYSLNVE